MVSGVYYPYPFLYELRHFTVEVRDDSSIQQERLVISFARIVRAIGPRELSSHFDHITAVQIIEPALHGEPHASGCRSPAVRPSDFGHTQYAGTHRFALHR